LCSENLSQLEGGKASQILEILGERLIANSIMEAH